MVDDPIEDWLRVEARRSDRLQHIGHGGLAFEGCVEVVEEVGVRDGERRLLCEGCQGLEFGVVEGADLVAVHVQSADQGTVERQRRPGVAPYPSDLRQLLEVRIAVGDRLHVIGVGHAPRTRVEEFPRGSGSWADRRADVGLHRWAMRRHVPGALSSVHGDRTGLAAAELGCVLENAFQHSGQVARVLADQRQHLAGRGLELQCFLEVVEQSGVAYGDRRLVGEGLQDRSLLLVERPDLGAAEVDLADPLTVDRERHARARAHVGLAEELGATIVEGLGRAILEERRLIEDGHSSSVRHGRLQTDRCAGGSDSDLHPDEVSVSKHHHALIGADQLNGPGEDAVEHDGQVSWVRADQFEDLARRRLEGERFGEFGVALLDVEQQPGVGDCVAGLCSERFEQFDLVGRERIDRVAEHENADRWPVARERDEHGRSDIRRTRGLDRLGVGRVGDVGLIVECQRDALTKHFRERRVVAEGALAATRLAVRAVSVERDHVPIAHEHSAT